MPHWPQIQVLGQPEPKSVIISTGEADPVCRPVRETHVQLPPTPHILTAALPTTPACTSTAEGTAISTPMHSTTMEPSVAALPVPQVMALLPLPSQPAASISKGSKDKIVEAVKRSIYMLLLTKEAVPTSEGKSCFIDIATEDGFRLVCGGAVVQKWDMEIELTIAMASVRRSFRDYALCRVQQAFGLRLPLDMDEIEHKRWSMKYLLADLRYLKKSIQINTSNIHIDAKELFMTEFFTDLIINILFLGNQQLHQFITHDNLDQVFKFHEGYYKAHPVAIDNWCDDYRDVMEVLESMQSNEEQRDWLTGLQQQMMMKGRLLHHASNS
ncbi:hypothetical protein L210DRAFT_933611 [Boletus edulis BED1]|uniref:Uncharacterized protein n=1 Tax=Boletus edulis BED1 TaxID=1328754 RepID=A0AAD4G6Y4_BOLED|nr:hypothetical protein L210DRAFT_933611 [Boletus edulis BED1]